VAVAYASAEDEPAARRWAQALGVACVDAAVDPSTSLTLVMQAGRLSLADHRQRRVKSLAVDFAAPAPVTKKQPLGRAVGRRTRSVCDATGGWGDDARRLWHMDYEVTVLERQPVMAALLADGLERAAAAARGRRPPALVECDAIEYLATRPGAWDCVYLDPMFPPKRRASTLARRPLRLLRELAGDDPDCERLFDSARRAATKRVVVKRPDHGAPAFGTPSETVAGKLVCYDIYFLE